MGTGADMVTSRNDLGPRGGCMFCCTVLPLVWLALAAFLLWVA